MRYWARLAQEEQRTGYWAISSGRRVGRGTVRDRGGVASVAIGDMREVTANLRSSHTDRQRESAGREKHWDMEKRSPKGGGGTTGLRIHRGGAKMLRERDKFSTSRMEKGRKVKPASASKVFRDKTSANGRMGHGKRRRRKGYHIESEVW